MDLMPDNEQPVVITDQIPSSINLPTKLISKVIGLLLGILLIILFIAPLNLYLNLYSLLHPQALTVNGNPVSWDVLKKEVSLVSIDKNLKTRQQILKQAIDKTIELQILRFAVTPTSSSSGITIFSEHQLLKNQVEKDLSWRNGGYFIARFTLPQASESAQVLKERAKKEITTLKAALDNGESFQKLLVQATGSSTLKYLDGGAFLPGVYLEKVTPDNFPLKIKNFRDKFFTLPASSVSDIITLSWDNYDGPNYGTKFSGEFAYAVAKIDKTNGQSFVGFNDWLKSQKQKVKVVSNTLIPFYFKWF